jgi:predicted metal-dependent peptidase
MMNDPLEMETGGADVKDLTIEPSKASALQGENNIRNTIKQALEACESAKSRGYMAGDMSQFIEADNVQPVVPWFQQVNQCVTRALSDERCITKKRLNRRDPDFGFGRLYQNTTTIVLVVDTSLSMYTDKADLSSVNSQADYLAQQADELWIVHNDADVAKAELYRRGMVLEEFFGCGGTDFEPALKYIRDELGIPDAIVFITDGYGGKLNDDDPVIGDWETELIWVLTPTGYTEDRFRESITNLGQVIKVESWV